MPQALGQRLCKSCINLTLYISYVTSVRYVAGINHEARGRAAPKGRVIYSGNIPNRGRDISNSVFLSGFGPRGKSASSKGGRE